MAWRTQTYGTTAGLTMSREPGFVHPPKKLVRSNAIFVILTFHIQTKMGNLKTKTFFSELSSLRVASGSAGPDGSLSNLLFSLLLGVPGSAVHHV